MKKTIKTLTDPNTLSKPDTKFFDEIHTKEFKTKRVNKKYLESFREDRKIREARDWTAIIGITILAIVITVLILSAYQKQNDQTLINSAQFYSLLK